MVRHIVMWKLKAENRDENLRKMKAILLALKGVVPEIVDIEFGTDFNRTQFAFDAALIVTLNKPEDVPKYIANPDHKKAGEFIVSVITDRAVVDFEV